jgi:membrane fusion protein, heavy metal efflux system
MKTNKFSIYLLLLAFVFISNSCKNKDLSGSQDAEVLPEDIVEMRADQAKLAGLTLGIIESRNLNSSLKANGLVVVAPQNLATICAPLGGFVISSFLMPGDPVQKGQTLAILENQEFIDIQQKFLETKNKFEFAEADFKRHSELYKDDVYSEQNVQQVQSDYKNLKAQLKALEQKLLLIGVDPNSLHEENISRSLPVLSPISGYVQSAQVNIGKFVSSSDIIFEIVNSNKLFLQLTLFEKDADKISVGQNLQFFINNETEKHNAQISLTGKSINPDKTYKVFAQVNDNCKNVLPGMYVNALIEIAGEQTMAIPTEAIVNFNDRDYIFIFDSEKEEKGEPVTEYKMVEVQKGISDEGYTGIRLPEGFDAKTMKVVVKGAYNLLCAKKNAGEMSC